MSVLDIKKKVLFIHIPKTAGTSMEETKIFKPLVDRHADLEHFYNLAKNDASLNLDDFFKFAFVRNPYTRFLSALLNHFSDNIGNPTSSLRRIIEKHRDEFATHPLTRPQHEFICRDGQIAVDFVGRFETLEKDWKRVCKKIGRYQKLPHLVQSVYPTNKGLCTPETKKLVQEMYRRDFELFYPGEL